MPSFQRYTFPSIATNYGVINVYVDSVSAGLIMPLAQTIKSIIAVTETASIDLSSQEVKRVEMEIIDDHSVYPEGFWVGLLYVQSYIILTLTEPGGAETCFFHGVVEAQTVQYGTVYSGTYGMLRNCKFTCKSTLSAIFSTLTSDWAATVVTNRIQLAAPALTGGPWDVMSIEGLFAAMLAVSGVNPAGQSYSANDAAFTKGTVDLQFKDGSGNVRDVSQLMVPIKYKDGGGSAITVDYFRSTEAAYLPNTFPTLGALLPKMLKNFGIRLVIGYDFATSRFWFKLLQCYRAYAGTVSFGTRLKRRPSSIATDLAGDAAKVGFLLVPTDYVWISKKYSNQQFYVVDPANYPGLQFDMDTTLIWHITPSTSVGPMEQLLCAATIPSPGGATPLPVTNVDWYNYRTATATTATDPSGHNLKLEQAICGYNAFRFMDALWLANQSTYSRLTALDGTESFFNVEIMKRSTFDDGILGKTYFMNSVKQDFLKHETEIGWIQEEV